jgi:hypothetical protein
MGDRAASRWRRIVASAAAQPAVGRLDCFRFARPGPADLIVQVQPTAGGSGVQFGLRVTSTTIITIADAGQTVTLRQGERFSLELGDGYLWNVIIADDTIVGPVDDGSVYEALQPGSTTLLVSGDPGCSRARYRCLIPSLSFEVQLLVT